MATSTVEDYLKQLYLEEQSAPGELVAMGRLATIMNVVPGTATTMIKALSDSGLVIYEPRAGAKLTPGGEQLALHVLRRHRLVELFLVKILGLDWAEVHAEAEELEHSISDKVLDRMDALLGHPSSDPHGDPIPSAKGSVTTPPAASLLECPLNEQVTISRIADQAPDFLKFADRAGLTPGAPVKVLTRDLQADAVQLEVAGDQHTTLGATAAAKIRVTI